MQSQESGLSVCPDRVVVWGKGKKSRIRSHLEPFLGTFLPSFLLPYYLLPLSSRDVFVVATRRLVVKRTPLSSCLSHRRTTTVFADQSNNLEEKVGDEEAQQAKQGNDLH